MTIIETHYGTYQVRVSGLMVAEYSRRSDAEAFLADPKRYGYGLIGG